MERPVPERCPTCGGRHFIWDAVALCALRTAQKESADEAARDAAAVAAFGRRPFEAGLEADRRDLEGLAANAVKSLGQAHLFAFAVEALAARAGRMLLGCRTADERVAVDAVVRPLLLRTAEAVRN